MFLSFLFSYFAPMYEKTRGIVLHTHPYNDTLSVVHIYTERYGRMSYMLPRGAGRAAKLARALYTPLSLIEFEMEYRPGRELQRIGEAHTWQALPLLQGDPARASLALFLAEFLGKVLQSGEAQPDMFAYIARSIELLGRMQGSYANFHLCFLVGLAPFLGITPNADSYRDGYCFNMQEGVFVAQPPLLSPSLAPAEAHFLTRLLRIDYTNMHLFRLSRQQRSYILDRMIFYYGLHLPGVGNMKSLAVLHAIFD